MPETLRRYSCMRISQRGLRHAKGICFGRFSYGRRVRAPRCQCVRIEPRSWSAGFNDRSSGGLQWIRLLGQSAAGPSNCPCQRRTRPSRSRFRIMAPSILTLAPTREATACLSGLWRHSVSKARMSPVVGLLGHRWMPTRRPANWRAKSTRLGRAQSVTWGGSLLPILGAC